MKIEGSSIRFVSVGEKPQMPVLLLHGAAFSSKTWEELGTLSELGNAGFHAIAIDLPNFGKSEPLKVKQDPAVFLEKLIETLDIERPVIISPSLSGRYSVPFLLQHGKNKLSGYIPVAPVIDSKYSAEDFKKSDVPTLIIYGENDSGAKRSTGLLSLISKSNTLEIPKGNHPAYLDDPKLFHAQVIAFLHSLK